MVVCMYVHMHKPYRIKLHNIQDLFLISRLYRKPHLSTWFYNVEMVCFSIKEIAGYNIRMNSNRGYSYEIQYAVTAHISGVPMIAKCKLLYGLCVCMVG